MKKVLFYFALIGLTTSTAVVAQNIWSEKDKDAKPLVLLPSIEPIIRQLDATVVNVSTSSEIQRTPRQPGPERGPIDPFSSPEEFFERFFGGPNAPQIPRRSMGSGFIISKDGFILTNNHVIDGADKVEVTVSRYAGPGRPMDQETFPAEIVGRDPRTDVALLKIKPKTDLPFAYLGNSSELVKGDWVVAIGNPFGLDHSVSVGIVSALGREITPNENRRFDDFIQTDAAINFGNSGGPLVNLKGEVVGINTAIAAQGSGIGFAVPISLVKEILPQLEEKGSVLRGFLGVMIQDVTPEMQDALGLPKAEGVLVSDVVQGGPAAKNLKPGDVIIEVEGQKTSDARSLQRTVANKPPGAKVQLKLIRNKKVESLSVELGTLDEASKPATDEAPRQDADRLGLVVSKGAGEGIEVLEVDTESAAFQSGILPGDRILQITYKSERFDIDSVAAYKKLLSQLKAGDSILISLQRQQGTQTAQLFVAFRVPKTDK